MRNLIFVIISITLIFSACTKKQTIESLYDEAEKMEADILQSVTTIAQYRSNCEKILLDAPDSECAPMACYKLGKLNEIFGHYQEAIDCYRKLLAKYPEHPIGADALFNIAQIYQLHLNDNEQAAIAYTQLVNFYPNEKRTPKWLVQLGQLLSQQEKWEDAVLYFQTQVERYPTLPQTDAIYFRMGDILQHKLNDQVRATQMYQTVMEKFPKSTWTNYAQTRLEHIKQGENKNEK
jgi:TolA-binding protein